MKTEFYNYGKKMTVLPKRFEMENTKTKEKEKVDGYIIVETQEKFLNMSEAFNTARNNLRK